MQSLSKIIDVKNKVIREVKISLKKQKQKSNIGERENQNSSGVLVV